MQCDLDCLESSTNTDSVKDEKDTDDKDDVMKIL